MKTKLSKKFYLALIIFSLIGQIAWVVENMYFNVFISQEFAASSYQVALMVSASAIAATLTTLLIGALSDKVKKRKIFICLGYILWGLSILCFALFTKDTLSKIFVNVSNVSLLGITLVIIFDCIMTFFGSSANDACFNSWITDSTDETNRGGVEGINSMMPLIAILVVFGALAGFASDGKWPVLFIILGVLTIVCGIVGFFIIDESKVQTDEENPHYFKNILYGFRISSMKKNKNLYLTLLGFALFGIGVQVFMTFLVQYYQVKITGQVLGFDKYIFILAPAIILAAVFTFFYGKVYDKFGFIKAFVPSISLLIIGLVILFIFSATDKQIAMKFIGSLLMMCGYLGTTAVFNAMIRDNTPKGKVGLYQGIRIIAQVLIPMLIGPWLGAVSLSGNFTYDESAITGDYSYPLNGNIFICAAIVMVITLIYVVIIYYTQIRKNKEEA